MFNQVGRLEHLVILMLANNLNFIFVDIFCLFQAYHELPKRTKFCHINVIRGDNYCALRGVLFQFLSQGLSLLNRWPSIDDVLASLNKVYDEVLGIKQWIFPNCLPVPKDGDIKSVMSLCLKFLFQKVIITLMFSFILAHISHS